MGAKIPARKAALSLICLGVLIVNLSSVLGGKTETSSASSVAVAEVEPELLDDFLGKHSFVFAHFYAPWCRHCQRLELEYEEAAQVLKSKGVRFIKVLAAGNEHLISRYSINGYPALRVIHNGASEPYVGGRSAEAFISFFDRIVNPAIHWTDSLIDGVAEARSHPVAFLGLFHAPSTSSARHFAKLSTQFPEYGIYIGVVGSLRVTAKGGEGIFVFRWEGGRNSVDAIHHPLLLSSEDFEVALGISQGRDEKASRGSWPYLDEDETLWSAFIQTASASYRSIADWIGLERFPLFGNATGDTFTEYLQSGRDLLWVVGPRYTVERPLLSILVMSAARELRKAKDKKSAGLFLWLDSDSYPSHAAYLGAQQYPSLVIQRRSNRYVYHENEFPISPYNITTFLGRIRAGTLRPARRSEPIGEAVDDKGVHIVVGSDFESIVFRRSLDVVLLVYAPWCGHCKRFESVFTELGKRLEGNRHIILAKMDGTLNDGPSEEFQADRYPAVLFVRAGDQIPRKFEGQPTIERLIEFVKKHSSKPVDIEGVRDEL